MPFKGRQGVLGGGDAEVFDTPVLDADGGCREGALQVRPVLGLADGDDQVGGSQILLGQRQGEANVGIERHAKRFEGFTSAHGDRADVPCGRPRRRRCPARRGAPR